MELIIGGASQGKLEYATDILGYKESDIINNLQDIIRAMLEKRADADVEVMKIIEAKPSCVIICNEIGCGLVPVDPSEREYRDIVGKICCKLAARAQRVHRVICGIGTVIKDA
ncbi:MAG: bifunctional adenosylcobinamide kinase/adenosylcobinamide-phosphate guanylyltransferase [Eubacteriales bacterium]